MTAKSTETLLQEVIDREAIRTLPVRYCHCVWQKDLDGYVNLFRADERELVTESEPGRYLWWFCRKVDTNKKLSPLSGT